MAKLTDRWGYRFVHISEIATIGNHSISEAGIECRHAQADDLQRHYPLHKLVSESRQLVSQVDEFGKSLLYPIFCVLYVHGYFYHWKHTITLQINDIAKFEKHMASTLSKVFRPAPQYKQKLKNETSMKPHFITALGCCDFILSRICNAENFRAQITARIADFDESFFAAGQVLGKSWGIEPAIAAMATHCCSRKQEVS